MSTEAEIDESKFVKNERPNQYAVSLRVTGYVRTTIMAGSLDEARTLADAMLDDEDLVLELDEATDAVVDYIRKAPTMYLVTRDGIRMQVSRLASGDVPRQPDKDGF